jgi:hypothetical protein
VFKDLLGSKNCKLPRVSVIEAFVENPEYQLSAPDVERITGVSRRAAYYIIQQLVGEGILVKRPRLIRPQQYGLNEKDIRTNSLIQVERLLTIGKLESEIKKDRGLEQSDFLAGSLLPYLGEIPQRWPTSIAHTGYEFIAARSEISPVPPSQLAERIPRVPENAIDSVSTANSQLIDMESATRGWLPVRIAGR